MSGTQQTTEGKEKAAAENPFDNAQLVLYAAEAEWADQEPTHEMLEKLGLVSWSLWARWEDEGVEIPIVGEASWHMWYSLSAEEWRPDPAEPVSDAFATAIVQMVDEAAGGGWGDIEEDVWVQLPDLEKYVVHLVRGGFLSMDAAEPALIIDWCQQEVQTRGE